jgi:hypothetical protein
MEITASGQYSWELWTGENDMRMYYSSQGGTDFIECKCSRWDQQDKSITLETWLKKSDLNTLRTNITPGAAGELFELLGNPIYYDQTWQGENTLRIYPRPESRIGKIRGQKYIIVKNITDTPITGPSGWLSVKIEGYISGMTAT